MDYRALHEVDIIGDVHGCYQELLLLLQKLNYYPQDGVFKHPEERKLVFVGDLCDRGPQSLEVLFLVERMVKSGYALHCPGNHDDKLMRWCQGRRVQVKHGLETTVLEIQNADNPDQLQVRVANYIRQLPLYLELDSGELIVAHAGIPTHYSKLPSKRLREICLYGFPTGQIDEHGLPERDPVTKHYQGTALLIHGHTPVEEPQWERNVINIDTGCVFGGKLTCLRYPEMEFVDVKALDVYGESKRFRPKTE